jgi:hypothetical protein
MRVEVALVEPGEDVSREGRRARSGGTQLVLDRLRELRHCRSGNDQPCDGRHCLLHRRDRTLHRLELLRGLHTAQLVHQRRPGTKPIGAEDAREVERRLRPDAVSDRDGLGRAQAFRDAFEDRGTVIGLVDDDDFALGLNPEIERREHAREDEDGLRVAGEEPAGDPAARVGCFAEVRDLPFDSGQVFEVGRRREEEHIDALRFHPFGQPPLPVRVVEHEERV